MDAWAAATIPLGHPQYGPLRELLADVHARYGRPILRRRDRGRGQRPRRLAVLCRGEVRAALEAGLPVEGICLYPVLDYPGWDDDRHCAVGLLSNADGEGRRDLHEPLAEELARQQGLLAAALRPDDRRVAA